jgi:hypothetical protein
MRLTPLLPLLLISATLGAGLTACTSAPKVEPAVVVEAFYAELLTHPVLGAPDSAQLSRLVPFLGDTLKARLVAARLERDREVARAPDEKPIFADEDLFTSLFEGPSAFYVMATRDRPAPAVLVRFSRLEGGQGAEWVDTVYVARRDTSWVVTDVHFGGTWPMAARGTLQNRLLP